MKLFINSKQTGILATLILFVTLIAVSSEGQLGSLETIAKVDSSRVCMTNNKDMGKKQIPVEVGGKTYYGCCPMCAKNLSENEAARFAIDPVTGEKVDKGDAIIGVQPTGDVLYFSSEENFKTYRKKNSE